MDSFTEHADGAARDGASGPEFTPLRRGALPAGVVGSQAESVAGATPAVGLESVRAAAESDGDEEFVAPRRTAPPRAAPTATDFTSERLLRPRAEVPHSGLRRLIYRLTGGRVNPGP